MEEEFVPHDIALELKNLGFDKWCFAVYTPEFKCVSHYGEVEEFTGMWKSTFPGTPKHFVPIPTYQQVFKWCEIETKYVCKFQYSYKC